MKRWVAVAALWACAAVAYPATAQDAFAAFKALCLDTEAHQGAALAAAERQGWEMMTGDRFDELVALSDVVEAQARVNPTADGLYVLLTGLQSDNDPSVPTDVCAVHLFAQRRPFDAVGAAQGWIKIQPIRQLGTGRMWEFVLMDGEPTAPLEAPAAQMIFGLIAYSDQQRSQFELARTARYR
jgi:hypothetical protein